LKAEPISIYQQQYSAQWKSHTDRMAKINYILQTTRKYIDVKTSKTLV